MSAQPPDTHTIERYSYLSLPSSAIIRSSRVSIVNLSCLRRCHCSCHPAQHRPRATRARTLYGCITRRLSLHTVQRLRKPHSIVDAVRGRRPCTGTETRAGRIHLLPSTSSPHDIVISSSPAGLPQHQRLQYAVHAHRKERWPMPSTGSTPAANSIITTTNHHNTPATCIIATDHR